MSPCDPSDECSVGIGIPTKGCPIRKYLDGCPIRKEVNVSSIHACPDKDACWVYQQSVIKKEIGLD